MRKLEFKLKIFWVMLVLQACLYTARAQFTSAEIGVNGLTCSQCTRAVEMSLLKLDFVKSVQMNLENTTGKILFKESAAVNLKKIAKAVTDAGFSMAYLKAGYFFTEMDASCGTVWMVGDERFCFVNAAAQKLKGETVLIMLGKEFMPRQDFSKWKKEIKKCCGEIKKETIYVAM